MNANQIYNRGGDHGNQGADSHNRAIYQAMVTRVVRDTVFPNKQFIVLERELDVTGKVAQKCLSALGMDVSQWDNIKDDIRKGLKTRRNNAQSSVRTSLKRECDHVEQQGISPE